MLLWSKEEALNECRRAVELRPISRDALEGPEYATNLCCSYGWIGTMISRSSNCRHLSEYLMAQLRRVKARSRLG